MFQDMNMTENKKNERRLLKSFLVDEIIVLIYLNVIFPEMCRTNKIGYLRFYFIP